MAVKVSTWNLCLGLPNKKDVIIKQLLLNNIDICCMQETEIDINYPTNILSSKTHEFECEKSTDKRRVGVYINRQLQYTRREDLEETDQHVIIIDVFLKTNIRIISLYRSFRPPNGSLKGNLILLKETVSLT